jgi:hypothetical protein
MSQLKKEYGVTRKFIETGIRAGKLEYRLGSNWGNPYVRLLRSQLESYIAEQLGASDLDRHGNPILSLRPLIDGPSFHPHA